MDKLNLNGKLTLKFFEKGVLIEEKTQSNLIVDLGYNALLKMMSTGTIHIEKIQVGQDETGTQPTDSEITIPLDLAITNRTVSDRKITFEFIFGSEQGNGTLWQEFGLICSDGTLFSRRVWQPINKIEELTINGTWEINL